MAWGTPMQHDELKEQLETQIAYWQKILRLQDWIVIINFWPHAALGSRVCQAEISRNSKHVVLSFRVPEDIPAVANDWPEGEAQDYDLSIVHELMHVLVHDMQSKEEWAEEQVCNIMARALVSSYRQRQPGDSCPTDSVRVTRQAGHYL